HLSRRRSQVVRQRSAKPLFIGSIPIAASNNSYHANSLRNACWLPAKSKKCSVVGIVVGFCILPHSPLCRLPGVCGDLAHCFELVFFGGVRIPSDHCQTRVTK